MSEDAAQKPWWKSKTVHSGIFTAIVGILLATGGLDNESVQELVGNQGQIITSLGIVLSGFITIYGRATAKTTIEKPKIVEKFKK